LQDQQLVNMCLQQMSPYSMHYRLCQLTLGMDSHATGHFDASKLGLGSCATSSTAAKMICTICLLQAVQQVEAQFAKEMGAEAREKRIDR